MNPAALPQPGMPTQQGPMQDAVAQQQLAQAIKMRLTPQEFAELDSYITPRFFELATKLEPGLAPLLQPFVQTDQMEDDAMAQIVQMGNTGAMPPGAGMMPPPVEEEQPLAGVFPRG